jgi:hypothetical protein
MRAWKFAYATALLVLMALPLCAQAQAKSLTIRLLNGKSGRPMKNERLLIFFGASPDDVRVHKVHLDLHTDANGEASLPLNEPTLVYLQVLVDFRTLCQEVPNSRSFSVEDTIERGMQTPNNCGQAAAAPTPGTFVVYARPATIKEKMDW